MEITNKQPFYHSAGLLFTAIRPIERLEIESVIRKAAEEIDDILSDSVEVEEICYEPGDPSDLM